MNKNSAIITIFSIIFVIVLIVTVVLSIKYLNKNNSNTDQDEIESTITPVDNTTNPSDSNQVESYNLEIEQVQGSSSADVYITNSTNISALEFTIQLPSGVKTTSTSNAELFYDFPYSQNGNELKVGALSLQVVSPKERYKFLTINFDQPINETLVIQNQTFLDQQGNEI